MITRSNLAKAGIVGGAILVGAQAVSLATPADALGEAKEGSHSYAVIISRNVFDLKEPAQPQDENTGPSPELPVVKLGGFIETDGQLKVLLSVKMNNGEAKASEAASYLSLAEGHEDRGITLVKAYPGQEMVDIINGGTPMTLSMKANGFATQAYVKTTHPRAVVPELSPPAAPGTLPPNGVPGPGATAVDGHNFADVGTFAGGVAGPERGSAAGGNPESYVNHDEGVLTGGAVAVAANRPRQNPNVAFDSNGSGGGTSQEGADNNPQFVTATTASRNPWVLNLGYSTLLHRPRPDPGDGAVAPASQ